MKLLTKKETDSIFDKNSFPLYGLQLMKSDNFNEAVNGILHDEVMVKKLLDRVIRIKAKTK
jgi:hypothetical protein